MQGTQLMLCLPGHEHPKPALCMRLRPHCCARVGALVLSVSWPTLHWLKMYSRSPWTESKGRLPTNAVAILQQ